MPLKEENYILHGKANLSLFSLFGMSHQYWLTKDSLVIETKFLSKTRDELPLEDIQSAKIQRIGAMYFKRILAIKMKEEFFKTHERPQVTTNTYDYYISNIPETEMISIIENIGLLAKNKSYIGVKKPVQTESKVSPEFEKGLKLQKKLNLYSLSVIVLMSIAIFALVIKEISGLTNYVASLSCFIISVLFISNAIVGFKYKVDYGLAVFQVSDVSGGRFIAHGGTAEVINVIKLIGGILFISLGIIFLILAFLH